VPGSNRKALAISTGTPWWVAGKSTRAEAARLAVETCSLDYMTPCLVVSVDGFLTIQIPKSRAVTGIFLPSTELDLPAVERERIAAVYQRREWRALARGRNGSWHPAVEAPTEAAAVEAASRSCSQADSECQLYAIGNFRVR
jgi:hypothetical protein